jgi:hypothetical protein
LTDFKSPKVDSKRKKLRTLKWTPLPESKLNSTFWRNNNIDMHFETIIDKDLQVMIKPTVFVILLGYVFCIA